jgi:hypothetical protein
MGKRKRETEQDAEPAAAAAAAVDPAAAPPNFLSFSSASASAPAPAPSTAADAGAASSAPSSKCHPRTNGPCYVLQEVGEARTHRCRWREKKRYFALYLKPREWYINSATGTEAPSLPMGSIVADASGVRSFKVLGMLGEVEEVGHGKRGPEKVPDQEGGDKDHHTQSADQPIAGGLLELLQQHASV